MDDESAGPGATGRPARGRPGAGQGSAHFCHSILRASTDQFHSLYSMVQSTSCPTTVGMLINVVGTGWILRHHWRHPPCPPEARCMPSRLRRMADAYSLPAVGKEGCIRKASFLLQCEQDVTSSTSKHFKTSKAGEDLRTTSPTVTVTEFPRPAYGR